MHASILRDALSVRQYDSLRCDEAKTTSAVGLGQRLIAVAGPAFHDIGMSRQRRAPSFGVFYSRYLAACRELRAAPLIRLALMGCLAERAAATLH